MIILIIKISAKKNAAVIKKCPSANDDIKNAIISQNIEQKASNVIAGIFQIREVGLMFFMFP